MYEPHERGTVMGLYYAAPLLGPGMSSFVAALRITNLIWPFYK